MKIKTTMKMMSTLISILIKKYNLCLDNNLMSFERQMKKILTQLG